MKLSDIVVAAGVTGHLVQDGEFQTLGKIGHRDKPKMLTFCESPRYLAAAMLGENVSCLLVEPGTNLTALPGRGLIFAENPRFEFYRVHHFLARNTDFYGSTALTHIGKNVRIHATAIIAESDVCIGDDCEIGPYVVVHPRSIIGARTRIQQHSVVGSPGFEYRASGAGLYKIDHTGGVWIGEDVDIHSGSVIDRAVYGGSTKVGHGTKLDCGVHLSHHSAVGRDCIIGARTSIMGNAIVGDKCRFGPHVVTANGISVGEGCYVSLGSVVTRNVPAGTRVTGNFAVEHSLFKSLSDRVLGGEFLPKDT